MRGASRLQVFRRPRNIVSVHPLWKSAMNNIPWIALEERIFSASTTSYGLKIILSPRQKSMKLMKYLVLKFCRVRDVLKNIYTGTLTTAKGLLQLSEHRRLAGCKTYCACFWIVFHCL